MASALYENVENWHRSGEPRDLLSSDETETFSFKRDVENQDDLYEEVSSKEYLLKEKADEDADAKENGHDHRRVNGNAVNGNGVHDKQEEDACDDNEEDEEGEEDEKGHDDQDSGEQNEHEPAPQVPFYGKTLVAPEYMNFILPEETPQREEETTEDDGNDGTAVADDSENIQAEDIHEDDFKAEERAFDPTVQKEVLEEDDLTLSEEESDEEDGDGVEEDESPVKVIEEDDKEEEEEEQEDEVKEEGEGEEDEEREEEVQEDSTGEESKLDHEGSPQLAQAEEEDEEQSEDDGAEGENVDDAVKEESLLQEEGEDEETESAEDEEDTQENETCPQLAKEDDGDDAYDEEVDNKDMETLQESSLKHSDSLRVQVASPTPDIGEVGSAAQSFDGGEGVIIEDDEDKDDQGQEQSLNETDEEDENRRTTFNGPVEHEKEVEAEEETAPGDDSCQSEETDEESGDETADIVCEHDQGEAMEANSGDEDNAEGGLDLDTIPEGDDVESDKDDQDEGFSVHTNLQRYDDKSDLTGKVKELGRMFEGGGPVFPPKSEKNDTDAADGCPVSVRRYKAIFEQDRLSAERAREPGRREELTSPPRGIVKNLRGLFENPQGFEARKG